MSKIYCSTCGTPHDYIDKKPKFCSECAEPLSVLTARVPKAALAKATIIEEEGEEPENESPSLMCPECGEVDPEGIVKRGALLKCPSCKKSSTARLWAFKRDTGWSQEFDSNAVEIETSTHHRTSIGQIVDPNSGPPGKVISTREGLGKMSKKQFFADFQKEAGTSRAK
jgi:hypothetical protein